MGTSLLSDDPQGWGSPSKLWLPRLEEGWKITPFPANQEEAKALNISREVAGGLAGRWHLLLMLLFHLVEVSHMATYLNANKV